MIRILTVLIAVVLLTAVQAQQDTTMKQYRVTYRNPKSPSSGQLHMTIEAASIYQAEQLFKAMYPNLQFSFATPIH